MKHTVKKINTAEQSETDSIETNATDSNDINATEKASKARKELTGNKNQTRGEHPESPKQKNQPTNSAENGRQRKSRRKFR